MSNRPLPEVGSRVTFGLEPVYNVKRKERQGRVLGYNVIQRVGNYPEPYLVALVQLDQGFYSPGEDTFISIMVVTPDMLAPSK